MRPISRSPLLKQATLISITTSACSFRFPTSRHLSLHIQQLSQLIGSPSATASEEDSITTVFYTGDMGKNKAPNSKRGGTAVVPD
jgi:hypothetical protein